MAQPNPYDIVEDDRCRHALNCILTWQKQ